MLIIIYVDQLGVVDGEVLPDEPELVEPVLLVDPDVEPEVVPLLVVPEVVPLLVEPEVVPLLVEPEVVPLLVEPEVVPLLVEPEVELDAWLLEVVPLLVEVDADVLLLASLELVASWSLLVDELVDASVSVDEVD